MSKPNKILAIHHLFESFCIFAFENHQNFKGDMTNEYSIDGITLRQRIEAMPEDCILFRSDFLSTTQNLWEAFCLS